MIQLILAIFIAIYVLPPVIGLVMVLVGGIFHAIGEMINDVHTLCSDVKNYVVKVLS